jgi:hypothetical protein
MQHLPLKVLKPSNVLWPERETGLPNSYDEPVKVFLSLLAVLVHYLQLPSRNVLYWGGTYD